MTTRTSNALTRAAVHEVIIETALVRQLVPEETQRVQHALLDVLARRVFSFVRDAERGETEARGGDARDFARVLAVGAAPIFDQPGLRISGFPEKEE